MPSRWLNHCTVAPSTGELFDSLVSTNTGIEKYLAQSTRQLAETGAFCATGNGRLFCGICEIVNIKSSYSVVCPPPKLLRYYSVLHSKRRGAASRSEKHSQESGVVAKAAVTAWSAAVAVTQLTHCPATSCLLTS